MIVFLEAHSNMQKPHVSEKAPKSRVDLHNQAREVDRRCILAVLWYGELVDPMERQIPATV